MARKVTATMNNTTRNSEKSLWDFISIKFSSLLFMLFFVGFSGFGQKNVVGKWEITQFETKPHEWKNIFTIILKDDHTWECTPVYEEKLKQKFSVLIRTWKFEDQLLTLESEMRNQELQIHNVLSGKVINNSITNGTNVGESNSIFVTVIFNAVKIEDNSQNENKNLTINRTNEELSDNNNKNKPPSSTSVTEKNSSAESKSTLDLILTIALQALSALTPEENSSTSNMPSSSTSSRSTCICTLKHCLTTVECYCDGSQTPCGNSTIYGTLVNETRCCIGKGVAGQVTYKAGTVVFCGEYGCNGTLAYDQTFIPAGPGPNTFVVFKGGTVICFIGEDLMYNGRDNGRVNRGVLAQGATINGNYYEAGSFFMYNESVICFPY